MTRLVQQSLAKSEDIAAFAKAVKLKLSINSIVLLSGDLGAGKTTFVSAFCELHNISQVQSPTYSLHNRYSQDKLVIDHFDLYRLETTEEIDSSGFFDLLNDYSDFCFIEWPERISKIDLPKGRDLFEITFTKRANETRDVVLNRL